MYTPYRSCVLDVCVAAGKTPLFRKSTSDWSRSPKRAGDAGRAPLRGHQPQARVHLEGLADIVGTSLSARFRTTFVPSMVTSPSPGSQGASGHHRHASL